MSQSFLQKSTSMAKNSPLGTEDKICSKGDIVILQPITLRIPNDYNIYSPSKLRPPKQLSYREFLLQYADHPKMIRVCFQEGFTSEKRMFQQSELITAYNFGLDCWHVVAPPTENARS